MLYFYSNPSVVASLREKTVHHERVGFFPYEEPLKSPHDIQGVCGRHETSLADFLGIQVIDPLRELHAPSSEPQPVASVREDDAVRECPRCGYLMPE